MSSAPSPAPDRLTALIDEVREAALQYALGWSSGEREALGSALAALRAEAASVEERLARAEAERDDAHDLLRAFVAWDDEEDMPNHWDALDTLFNSAREIAARTTTSEGNHAK